MSLLKSTGTIGGLTLISRILGFVRDLLMARFIGAGFASDAFLVAFRLPNLFRALFAEGAFTAAFVPMFNQAIGGKADRSEAISFAEQVLSVLALFLFLFTAVMLAAAVPVVWAMTGGFSGEGSDKFDLTVGLSRITIPYLAMISLASLFAGILNSLNRFWVAAAAPILLNICLIVALIFFRGETDESTVRAQAIAVTVSGVLQLAWVAWAARQAGMALRLRRPRLTGPVRQMLRLILPAAVGAGAVQINLLVSTLLAARFLPEGSISYLYYADRLIQLPLALIGIGVGTALLPLISRQLAKGDTGAALHNQNRAMELSLLLTVPAAVGLAACALPIVEGLLHQGAFTSADAVATAKTLAAFAIGLPAFVLVKILTPGFHARSDTRTPVRIAMVAMVANLVLNLILIWDLAYVGLALSTSAAAWLNAGLLYVTLKRRDHFRIDPRLARMTVKILAAAGVSCAVVLLLNPFALDLMGGGLVGRAEGLSLLVVSGGLSYFAAAWLMGAVSLQELRKQLGR